MAPKRLADVALEIIPECHTRNASEGSYSFDILLSFDLLLSPLQEFFVSAVMILL